MDIAATLEQFLLSKHTFEPAYLRLHRCGELQQRVDRALEALHNCALCPRNCAVDRTDGQRGVCQIDRYARVSSYFPHLAEEDCLRGWEGSGTIFFSGCSLRCAFCQNYDISHCEQSGTEVRPRQLAAIMLELQAAGCHNINVVTPGHIVPQLLESLLVAADHGLHLPIVYNTSGYDSLATLQLLDGVVDIYMPDFKFWDAHMAQRYLKAQDYPEIARQAVKEMYRQVGDLKFDEDGLAKRGLLVRHLVMPERVADTSAIMRFLADEVSANTYVNVMQQYYPSGKVSIRTFPEINRLITASEYDEAVCQARSAGLWRLDERCPRQPWLWG